MESTIVEHEVLQFQLIGWSLKASLHGMTKKSMFGESDIVVSDERSII